MNTVTQRVQLQCHLRRRWRETQRQSRCGQPDGPGRRYLVELGAGDQRHERIVVEDLYYGYSSVLRVQ